MVAITNLSESKISLTRFLNLSDRHSIFPISSMIIRFVLVANGSLVKGDWEKRVRKILRQKNVNVILDIGTDDAEATVWTTDLSYDYVKINASYRS